MHRRDVREAFDAAVAAVDPASAVAESVAANWSLPSVAEADSHSSTLDGCVVIGIGKAAPSMVTGLSSVISPSRGIVISDHEEPCPFPVIVGDHPIPGRRSLRAGTRLIEFVTSVKPRDTVVFCISGGASAVAEVPVAGVGIDDLASLTSLLLRSPIPIEDANEIRAAVSQIKAGGLAAMVGGARSVTFVVSDVVGGGPERVGSGPSISSDLGDRANAVVDHYGLRSSLPAAVAAAIERGRSGERFRRDGGSDTVVVVASPDMAAVAATRSLERLGVRAEIATRRLAGETSDAVRWLIGLDPSGPAVVAAGETTLEVTGAGRGGRNQHAAVAASVLIEGTDRIFGAFATDGRDGQTEAAGAIVDGGSAARMRANGIDPTTALERFASNAALEASGDLLVTGPTGTNVADVWIAGSVR